MKRPWLSRIWFWKPETNFAYYWDRTLSIPKRLLRIAVPVFRGGDEYDWHTICVGWTFTGRVIVATRRCNARGRCKGMERDLVPDWPIGNEWVEVCACGATATVCAGNPHPDGWRITDYAWCPKCAWLE